MEAKPLSYVSLKCVLEHLEANLRFQLSWICPSIRKTEKVVPLKIECLKFNPDKLTVNITNYKLSMFCGLRGNKINHPADMDKYGIEDRWAGNIVTPGDVLIGNTPEGNHTNNLYHTEQIVKLLSNLQRFRSDLNSYMNSLQLLEHKLQESRSEYERNKKPEELPWKFLPPSPECDMQYFRHKWNSPCHLLPLPEGVLQHFRANSCYVSLEQTHWKKCKMQDLENEKKGIQDRIHGIVDNISNTLNSLATYRNRCGKTHAPNEFYIHLSISKPDDEQKQLQCIKCNIRLHEAQKCLSSHLFDKRCENVQVKCLDIPCDVIIRLPLGLKLKIRELKTWNTVGHVYQALHPIIDDLSYPLNCLEIRSKLEDFRVFNHPIVESAKNLIISNEFQPANWHSIFLSLKNQKVYCKFDLNFLLEGYILFIQNWLENGRKIGSCFSFIISKEKTLTELLHLVKNQFHRAITVEGTRCVILPMNQTSDLCVYYESAKKIEGFGKWFLKMEVVERGLRRRHVSIEPQSTKHYSWFGGFLAAKIPM